MRGHHRGESVSPSLTARTNVFRVSQAAESARGPVDQARVRLPGVSDRWVTAGAAALPARSPAWHGCSIGPCARDTRLTEATMMFLDCPAYLDQDGAVRCGLPAEVRCRFTMRSTDGPIESAMIRCPAGH